MASTATHQINLEFNDTALIKGLAALDNKLNDLAKKLSPKIKPEIDNTKINTDLQNFKNTVASLKFDKLRGLEIDPANINKIKTDIVRAVDSAKITPAQANTLFSALNSVTPKISKIKPEIDISQARSQGLNFGELFSAGLLANLASSGIQNAISGIFSFLGKQFDGAKAFETTRVAFDGILGSADKAGKVMKDVVEFANKTPFEIPELANSAKMLAAFGTSAENIMPQIKSVGDVSAGLNIPIEQMAYLVGTIQTQGRAMTADLNQFANRGVPIWQTLSQMTGKTGQELRKMAENGEISSNMINQAFTKMSSEGGAFYNMMYRVSNTVNGRLSTLSDTMGGLGRQILGVSDTGEIIKGGLFDKISQGVLEVTNILNTLDFSVIGQGIGAAIDFVTQNFGLLSVVLGGLAAGGIVAGIVSSFTALGAAITAAGGVAAFFGGIMATVFSPIVLIVASVALAVTGLYLAWQSNFMGIQEIVAGVWSAISEFLTGGMIGILQSSGEFAKGFMGVFSQTFTWIQTNILPIFGSFINLLLMGLGQLIQSLATNMSLFVSIFGSAFQQILTFSAPFIVNMVELFINMSGSIGDVIGGMMDVLAGFLSGDMSKIVQGGAKIFSGLVGVVASVAQSVLKTVESALNAGIDMINKLLENPTVQEGLKRLGIAGGPIGKISFGIDLKGMADAALADILKDTGQNELSEQIKSRNEANKSMAETARAGIQSLVSSLSSINFAEVGNSIAALGQSATSALQGTGQTIQGMTNDLAKNPIKIDASGFIDSAVGNLQGLSKSIGNAMKNAFKPMEKNQDKQGQDMIKQAQNMVSQAGSPAAGGGSPASGGKSGSGSGANNEIQKEIDAQKKAQEEINKLKLESIQEDKKRSEELAKYRAEQDIKNFVGTEDQKAKYAKLRQEQLNQELTKINKDFSEKQNKLESLNQKQTEFTDKNKELTRIFTQNQINQVQSELSKIGTASFGVSPTSTVTTGQPTTQPTQPTSPVASQMSTQPIQRSTQPDTGADPKSLIQPVTESVTEANEQIDSLIEKIKTGLAGAITEGSEAIKTSLQTMDESTIEVFNLINENWSNIASQIGQNVITGLINAISKGERFVYSAIASLETNALKAVNIEIKSREEFGEKEGRGAALGVPSVVSPFGDIKRGFESSFAGSTTNKNLNIGQVVNNNSSDTRAMDQLIKNYT